MSYCTEVTSKENRTRYISVLGTAKPLGLTLGPVTNLITAACNFSLFQGSMKVDSLNAPGLLVSLISIIIWIFTILYFENPTVKNQNTDIHEYREDEENSPVCTINPSPSLTKIGIFTSILSAPMLITVWNVFFGGFYVGVIESTLTPIANSAFQWGPVQISLANLALSVIGKFY